MIILGKNLVFVCSNPVDSMMSFMNLGRSLLEHTAWRAEDLHEAVDTAVELYLKKSSKNTKEEE